VHFSFGETTAVILLWVNLRFAIYDLRARSTVETECVNRKSQIANGKAAQMSGLFNIVKTPGQAVLAGLAAAVFLALITVFLRLM
jgi:hypothetical protein